MPQVRNRENGPKAHQHALWLSCLITTLIRAPALHAGELAYGAGYVADYTSNIARTPTNENSEMIHSVLAGMAYQETTADINARVLAQADYRDYSRNSFSDESAFFFDGAGVVTIVPQQLNWTVEDTYRQIARDVTVADVPTNRSNANVFNTGPDVFFRFTPLNTIVVGTRYGNVQLSDSEWDHNRRGGYARWLYQSTPSTTWSLNLETLSVEFDDALTVYNYARRDGFFRFDFLPSRSRIVLDAGTSAIEREQSENIDGTLVRLTWVRELTSDSKFGLSLGQEFMDIGSTLLAGLSDVTAGVPTLPPTGLVQEAANAEVFYVRRGEFFYTRTGAAFSLDLRGIARDLDYEAVPQDREDRAMRLALTYHQSATSALTVFGDHAITTYLSLDRKDTAIGVGARLTHLLNRSLSLVVEGRRNTRTSTDASAEFDENRILLALLYSSGSVYAPIIRR
jgi:hypothetical protein